MFQKTFGAPRQKGPAGPYIETKLKQPHHSIIQMHVEMSLFVFKEASKAASPSLHFRFKKSGD